MSSFKNNTLAGFKNALNFNGTATQTEYWWFALVALLIAGFTRVLGEISLYLALCAAPLLLWSLLALLSLTFRRVQDAGGNIVWVFAMMLFPALVIVGISMQIWHDMGWTIGLRVGVSDLYMVLFFLILSAPISLVAAIVTLYYAVQPTKKAPEVEAKD
jgi:uncharacterized membrane protein YhaH (DUF805 family)